jgi:UDP-GlcNAc:undecaprenyl-phosphate/decaprenyl-phosphate GlcNAc-1-phosphate transferase
VIYLYAWTIMLAGVALALKFVPYDANHNHYRLGWSLVMAAILLIAAAASVYLVYVLEIFKFRYLKGIQLRKVNPETSQQEIDEAVERDIETGEFDAVNK